MIWKEYINRIEFDSYSDFYENFDYRLPQHFNFTEDVVLRRCAINPPKTAIIYVNDENERKALTYSDLDFLIKSYTCSLYQQGIRQGDRILIRLGRDINFIPIVLAIVRLGAIACPTPLLISDTDLEKRIIELNPKLIIDKESLNTWNNELKADTIERPEIPLDLKDEDMFIYYTSGSQGESKQIHHAHLFTLSFIANGRFMCNFGEDDIMYNFAETGWAAYILSFISQFWFGCTTFIYDFDRKPNMKKFAELVNEFKLTMIFCPPSIVFNMIEDKVHRNTFSSVKDIYTGGGILSKELYDRFHKAYPDINLLNEYGQTEYMCNVVGVYRYFEDVPPTSLGKPCPKSNMYLEDVIQLSDEHHDNIYEMMFNLENYPIGLSTNFKGYKDYSSGDLLIKDDKDFLYYYSRNDDIINVSAYRFSTTEIESCIKEIEGVENCVVIGISDLQKGEIPKAFVVLKNKKDHNFRYWDDVIKKYVKNHLAPYKYPRIIEYTDELPITQSGKIAKMTLKQVPSLFLNKKTI